MSWWNRTKLSPQTTTYNPATDEVSLDRCVRRLNEILEEMGPVGSFLETGGELMVASGPDMEKRLAVNLERMRIPGYCSHKLVAEAWTLMELITVRVFAIRKLYAYSGNTKKLRKLDGIQAQLRGGNGQIFHWLASV
jgi:hypothetical protein